MSKTKTDGLVTLKALADERDRKQHIFELELQSQSEQLMMTHLLVTSTFARIIRETNDAKD